MIGSAVAKRYATALYELADEQKLVDTFGKDLEALSRTLGESEELRSIFEDPQYAQEAKRSVARAIAERLRVHPLTKNAVAMLVDRRRMKFLPEIAEAFQRIVEKRSGRVRAEVVTATKLPDAYYAQLQQTLRQVTGRDVILVRREDPSLIGGVVTTVGGRVFDGSVKNRLRELRSQLLASTDPSLARSE